MAPKSMQQMHRTEIKVNESIIIWQGFSIGRYLFLIIVCNDDDKTGYLDGKKFINMNNK